MSSVAVGSAVAKRLSGRAKAITMILIIVIAVYLLAITPVRTYIQQRQQMAAAEQRYHVLQQSNQQLQQRAQQLQSDDEIKKLARERYELVEPGQQAYAVMPPSPAVTKSTETAAPAKPKRSVFETVWDTINPWN